MHAQHSRVWAALLVVTIWGCAACAEQPPTEPAAAATPVTPGTAAEGLVAHTVTARTDEGLPALTPSTCATDAALARATDLVGAPDLTHAPLDDVMADCGVSTAAENLSRAPVGTEPQDVVDAWMESPGHRANILDPELTQVGVGCVEDADAMLCSQIFLGPEA